MSGVVEAVAAFIARHGAPGTGERVLVACSGGGDSTALLFALAEAHDGPLLAVYVDHGLRPGTNEEAAHVERIAARAGAGFALRRVVCDRPGNVLAAARRARYAALADEAQRASARFVAVGHTATDQAETVLFRAARGDVAHALAGMPSRRILHRQEDGHAIELLRPLLDLRREDAAAFATARAGGYLSDPTNARPDLTRTALRAALVSRPERIEAANAVAARAADRVALLDAAAAALGPLDDLCARDVAAAGLDVALRLLRRAGAHHAGLAHARAFLRLCAGSDGTRAIDIGHGLTAERRYGRLRLAPAAPPPAAFEPVLFGGPGRYRVGDRLVEATLVEISPRGDRHARAAALVDPALLEGPHALRAPRAGDRLRSAVGGRKLQDVFVDRKIPRPLRAGLLVLAPAGATGGAQLAWVESIGPSHPVRATERGLLLAVSGHAVPPPEPPAIDGRDRGPPGPEAG